ncbi:MAG: hypothetical protein WDZ51_11410 [Pirellulaceae bacterium]
MASPGNNPSYEALIWQGNKSNDNPVRPNDYYSTNVMDEETREMLKNAKPLPRPRQSES